MKGEIANSGPTLNGPSPIIQIRNLDRDVKSLNWIGKDKQKRSLLLGSSLDAQNKNAPAPTVVEISSETMDEMKADKRFFAMFQDLRKGGAPAGKGPSIEVTQRFPGLEVI